MKPTRAKKGKAREISSPTTSSSSILKTGAHTLWCLLEGQSTEFKVDISVSADVADLKGVIKTKTDPELDRYAAHTLALFKLTGTIHLKPSRTLGSRIQSLEPHLFEHLEPNDKVSEIFPNLPTPDCLHIYVQLPPDATELKTKKRSGDYFDDLSKLQENQAKRYRSGETPSHSCSSAKAMKSQQANAEILNGRPWTSSGPPVGLYHRVFDYFIECFKEAASDYKTASSTGSDDSQPSIDDAFRVMRDSSQFYVVETSGVPGDRTARTETVLPTLGPLLGVSLHRVKNVDGTEPDVTVIAKMPAGHDARLLIAEIKLESRIAGDAKMQAQRSYARTCSLPDYDAVRSSSCSPCFLIEIAGPWITVLGAVFVHKVIVQHLAGPIYLSPQLLHPQHTIDLPLWLFSALRKALNRLRMYYETLPHQTTISRFFPHISSYKIAGSDESREFVYKNRLSTDDSKAIYLAEANIDGLVVVKFCSTYNVRAHTLLAQHQLAPPLIYDGTNGPRYGGLFMIVMGYVNGQTLNKVLRDGTRSVDYSAIIHSVDNAIQILHAENLVFGDLRTPNILIDESDKMKLVDYDWCGTHQEDKYPFIIGDGIEWAEGVGPYALLNKHHDIHMLNALRDKIERNAEPGSW